MIYFEVITSCVSCIKTTENNLNQAIHLEGRVFALGRLDKDSEGLMLLTNQGDVVNKIMRAKNRHPKTYRVWVDQPLTERFLLQMAKGVEVLGTITLPCKTRQIDNRCFEIVLEQGLNRQIRRMCKVFGYRVIRLQRTALMMFTLDGLPSGECRRLTQGEVSRLYSALITSTES